MMTLTQLLLRTLEDLMKMMNVTS